MTSDYSTKRLIDNIYYLAREKGLKISDIENIKITEGDEEKNLFSPGYFSRLQKSDTPTAIGADKLKKIADKLETTMDMLVNFDYTGNTPTENLVANFIKKLVSDTKLDRIHWDYISSDYIDRIESGTAGHPLFKPEEYTTLDIYDRQVSDCKYVYQSSFFPDEKFSIAGDCYSAKISDISEVYLMKISSETRREHLCGNLFLELYLVKGTSVNGICISASKFNELLSNLYNIAQESSRHMVLSNSAKTSILAFLTNGKDTFAGDDIDF